MLSNGYILSNRYRIDSIAGKGGLSVVYRAYDLEANDALRAVKEISKHCPEIIQSATQESQLIKELYERDKFNFFPNIIQRIETDEFLYIVMDYIDGTSMQKLLADGAFPPNLTIEYAKDICSVIQFIHDYGKIYSDMKPDNLMVINGITSVSLNKGKRSGTLKLIDFGAVVQMESGIPVQYTPEYAAPEQFRAKRLDVRTDIFNIGATLYHMITGRKPLPVADESKNLRKSSERFVFDSSNRNINEYLKKVILRCVSDDPSKRYKTCTDLYHALEKTEHQYHVKLTVFSAFVTLFSTSLCLFSYLQCTRHENLNYERLMMTAEKSASYTEKTKAYKNAIQIRKDCTDAYFGLIDAYKSDVSFQEKEAYELTKLITSNAELLKENSDYELLAFETGKLYWYYYDYGTSENDDNNTTRITSSTEWFAEALGGNLKNISEQKYQMAEVYYNIGKFHSDIQKLVIEGDDTDVYQDYWNSINNMTEFIENSHTETEIVLLETYKLAISSLETYSYKFSSFALYDEQMALYSKVKNAVDNIITTTEKTEKIKQNIINRYSAAERMIEKAYGGKK